MSYPGQGAPECLRETTKLLNYVGKSMVEAKFRGHTQEFLPKPALDFATRIGTIRDVITEQTTGWLTPSEQEDFVSEICGRGRKMFITCVYAEKPMQFLRTLLNSGLDDYKYPFSSKDCPAQISWITFKNSIIANQRFFGAAFFKLNSEQSLDDDMPKPIDYDESKVLGRGAFGEVVKVHIREDQRNFSSVSSITLFSFLANHDQGADKKGQFAMKITEHKGTREETFHRAMAELYHCHLVKCLASFIYSSKYYMIYEKANCNVEEFMVNNPHPQSLSTLTLGDFAQQLFGLADGLSFVHNQGRPESDRSNDLLSVPGQSSEKTGYFHDIKPENLLMFIYDEKDEKKYWIRLSDFSCAKVVDLVASVSGQHMNSWRSMSKSGTPIYRPPETSDTGRTSRPYDIWSLGCVYLELLVWFLDGYGSLVQFREARKGLVSPRGREDEGFYFTHDQDKPAHYEVRPAVIDTMKDMSKRCKGHLKDIADIIPRLLQINPDRRPTAVELVKLLKHIDTGARPPVEIGPSEQKVDRSSSVISLPTYSSDSDSDYGVQVNVQQPTTERSSP